MRRYDFDKIVDLSHELANGMPIYPGDPEPSFERISTIAKNGVNVSHLELGSHTGTHVDAPHHFLENGIPIDKIPVSEFIGEALVVDLSFKQIGSGITPDDLKKALHGLDLVQGDFLLCYTGCSDLWGKEADVNSNFTYVTKESARFLVSEKKIRAVGIDCLSIEEFHSQDHATHVELLKNNVFIIESLSSELKRILQQRVLFMCPPIKFEGGDGAPCRAIAVPRSRE